MDRDAKTRELSWLRSQVEQLERDLQEPPARPWTPTGFYTAHHVLAGFVLGMFGAATSLLVNIIGSLVVPPAPPVPDTPLRLINVYLTFPLGEAALRVDQGLTLAIGCCLYLATGMLLGIPFQLVLARWFGNASIGTR